MPRVRGLPTNRKGANRNRSGLRRVRLPKALRGAPVRRDPGATEGIRVLAGAQRGSPARGKGLDCDDYLLG